MRLTQVPASADRARVARRVAELALDAEQPVVLGDALGARRRPGLDLAGPHRDDQVGDRGVLGLAGAVRDDGAPAGPLGHLDGLERLGQRPDLVELDQDRVRRVLLDRRGRSGSVFVTSRSSPTSWTRARRAAAVSAFQPSQSSSARPSSIETIGIARDPVGPEVDEFARVERPALLGEHVARRGAVDAGARLDQLGRRGIEGDRDVLAGAVAGLLDGAEDDLDGGLVRGERRGEAAFVALPGGEPVVVEDRAQRSEDLGPGAQGLAVGRHPDGHDHELLEVGRVLGVLAAVEDVEHRDRQRPRPRPADVAVERQVVGGRRRVGAGQRDAEDGVRAQAALVGVPSSSMRTASTPAWSEASSP